MKKLKPCPFCGGQAIRVSHPGTNWDGSEGEYITIGACHNLWYVGCPHNYFDGIVPHCEIVPAAKWFASLREAEKAWNSRISTPASPNHKPRP